MEEVSERMPDKDKMIIVQVRGAGFDYVGRIEPEVLEPGGIPGSHFKLYQPTAAMMTEKSPGNLNIRCTDLSKVTFWEEGPIYIPRNMSIIIKVKIAGPLWNAYRNSIGEKIQVHESMPDGVPPPPGKMN